jgi:hypothetical protein
MSLSSTSTILTKTQGINSLRRQYWQNLSQSQSVTEELTSKYRTTIKLKLRLADNEGNKPKQKANWLLGEDNLIKPETLQQSFDKVIQEKKQFMEVIQEKKKSDSGVFANFLFPGIANKIKEIVELEKKIENYNQDKGKANPKDKQNRDNRAIDKYVKTHNSLVSHFAGNQILQLELAKSSEEKNGVFTLNSKEVDPKKEQLFDLYHSQRSEIFKQKNQLKNKLLLDRNFQKWLPDSNLNETLKRDIVNTFVNTELTTIENMMMVTDKLICNNEKSIGILDIKNPNMNLIQKAKALIGNDGQSYLRQFGTGDYSDSKKDEKLSVRVQLIQDQLDLINNSPFATQIQ